MQKVLDENILKQHPLQEGEDRTGKVILALLVEVGECANEWRGFKFWSKDQEAKTFGMKPFGIGTLSYNPLLEEYVDGLHFLLHLGIKCEIEKSEYYGLTPYGDDVSKQFLQIYYLITEFQDQPTHYNYNVLMQYYLGLGEMLGFTPKQIEQAYISKNEINHQRQETGY